MTAKGYAIRDTVFLTIGILIATIGVLWGAWHLDFSVSPTTYARIISAIVLASFVLFVVLFVTLVYLWRANRYGGERVSSLHRPMVASTATLMIYFGIASISAIDVWYEPARFWTLTRDPTVRLVNAMLILAVVLSKAWLLYEILPNLHGWYHRIRPPRKIPAGGS
jgi:predicted cation transporter